MKEPFPIPRWHAFITKLEVCCASLRVRDSRYSETLGTLETPGGQVGIRVCDGCILFYPACLQVVGGEFGVGFLVVALGFYGFVDGFVV